MSTPSPASERLQRILEHPAGGVTGLVDELLAVCREHGLQLDWQGGRCRVRPIGSDWQEVAGLSLRKSVFRAILARLAALCNARTPDAVSPYGGEGEFVVGTNPSTVFRVRFANTLAEQKLELTTETGMANGAAPQDQATKQVSDAVTLPPKT
jgi:hypothetical protein